MANLHESALVKIIGFVSRHFHSKLQYFSELHALPMSRLIAYAIDQELSKEIPFERLSVKLPTEDVTEFAYADQAGKLISYLRHRHQGLTIDQIIHLRHDIGVTDIDALMFALKDSIERGFVVEYTPEKRFERVRAPMTLVHYRLKIQTPKVKKKGRKRVADFERYQRLKKRFEKE